MGAPSPSPPAAPSRLWLRRLGWLAAFWLGGVAVLGVVALVLRVLMRAAGMR